jgi:hypothetical protein
VKQWLLLTKSMRFFLRPNVRVVAMTAAARTRKPFLVELPRSINARRAARGQLPLWQACYNVTLLR